MVESARPEANCSLCSAKEGSKRGNQSKEGCLTIEMIELFECGSCGAYHPVDFEGDCRDDANRYGGPEDYAERNNVNIADIEIVDDPLDEDEEAEPDVPDEG